MNNWRDSVKVQALSLAEGESMQGECPKCGRTDSFYITREDGQLKFIDFSVHCGYKGIVDSRGDVVQIATSSKPKKLWNGTLTKLIDEEVDFLHRKFRIKRELLLHIKYCEDDGRVYFPQHDSRGIIAGYIARYYPELSAGKKQYGAKALWRNVTRRDTELYFPTIEVLNAVCDARTVVLVEDYPSALRLWSQEHLPACALGGTTLYEEHVHTLIDLKIERIILILDADAIVKAVKLKRQLALAFPATTVIPLTGRDPKDMTPAELSKLCGRIK